VKRLRAFGLATGSAALVSLVLAVPAVAADEWTRAPIPHDTDPGASAVLAGIDVFSTSRATAVGYTFQPANKAARHYQKLRSACRLPA
jgi:hypothetical protein